MSDLPRVVVAMSGGVDSSVAAALLKEQGYTVIGAMLALWTEPGFEDKNRCCAPEAMNLARRVAAILGIPFYALDARRLFHQRVVQPFIDGYAQGITPNPCLFCNRWVRWDYLLNWALAFGAEFLATGHYARIVGGQTTEDGGRTTEAGGPRTDPVSHLPSPVSRPPSPVSLYKARDDHKDQSYVLHQLTQDQLSHTILPLGELTKPEVRQLARRFNLPVAERPDSQDLCFVGDGDYRAFLTRQAPNTIQPGPILTREGEQIGSHQGLVFYTIGQRKGLNLSTPQPRYVLEKILQHNALIVGTVDQLGATELTASQVNWVNQPIPKQPFTASVKIRYKALEAPGLVTPLPNQRLRVRFDTPQRDITPGQAAVIYTGERCLGGGVVDGL